ncbi:hypothetical protein ABZ801_04485 [Actinomadura sp. NPDC047616]|uniref:hypothetical protein n=1 Tax=Actinomadura sp. NPDC047616 TaxID=3155914 RepID=UPI0033EA1B87
MVWLVAAVTVLAVDGAAAGGPCGERAPHRHRPLDEAQQDGALLADAEGRVNEATDKLIAEPDFNAVMTTQSSDSGLSDVA